MTRAQLIAALSSIEAEDDPYIVFQCRDGSFHLVECAVKIDAGIVLMDEATWAKRHLESLPYVKGVIIR